MQEKNYTIKTMNRKEVDIAIEWAATEGWNPGLNDAPGNSLLKRHYIKNADPFYSRSSKPGG